MLNINTQTNLTLSLPDMRICVDFSTVYNDMLVAKGLNAVLQFLTSVFDSARQIILFFANIIYICAG